MHPTANVYEQVNRKCPQAPRNTILQLSTPYTDPELKLRTPKISKFTYLE